MSRFVLALAAVLAPQLASAQSYLNFKMISTQANPFPYYVDSRSSTPGGLQTSSMRQSVESAWASWNAVTCAVPKVQSKGLTGGAVPNPPDISDIYNVTPVWVTSTSDATYVDLLSPYTVAITVPISYSGMLQTCDSFFNGANYAWSVLAQTPSNSVDLETVMLHEGGHCLGFDHWGNFGNIMYQSIGVGSQQRTLGGDEVAALCQRYPLTGAPGSPCLADGGCGAGTNVKCVTQPLGGSKTITFCSQGCSTNVGANCDFPLYCQTASTFNPGYNGACLYPATAVTQVGKPCTTMSAAPTECGNSISECLTAPDWPNGYCSQLCGSGKPQCPPGSICTTFNDNTQHCLSTCRVGLADCRGDYACAATSNSAICIPACHTSADCSDSVNYECRTCDGLCVSKQNPVGQIGDVCVNDTDCGAGQICMAVDTKSSLKQCTQQCSSGCGVCPTGSTCHPLARGDLYCLRDCTGPFTCPQSERCGQFATGLACIPACNNTSDCPVGQDCQNGECLIPENLEDGGNCGQLCNVPDSGHPIVVGPKDAGTGNGTGSAGCGCDTTPAEAAWVVLAMLAALSARKVAAWRR